MTSPAYYGDRWDPIRTAFPPYYMGTGVYANPYAAPRTFKPSEVNTGRDWLIGIFDDFETFEEAVDFLLNNDYLSEKFFAEANEKEEK